MSDNQKRDPKIQFIKYIIVRGKLWWRDMEGVLLKCVHEEYLLKNLNEMRNGLYGGDYMAKKKVHKVIRVGFWWPTLFKDIHELV